MDKSDYISFIRGLVSDGTITIDIEYQSRYKSTVILFYRKRNIVEIPELCLTHKLVYNDTWRSNNNVTDVVDGFSGAFLECVYNELLLIKENI